MSKVAVIMGSKSDQATMSATTDILDQLGVDYAVDIISAHRTPEKMMDFAKNAKDNGYSIIIAGAGGAAHLPGMVAAATTLPVIGVPIQSAALNGFDSLLSIVQMPSGVPVATVAIGTAGAKNAAYLAAQILALQDEQIAQAVANARQTQTEAVLADEVPTHD
ncbi:5-(carboxyamino)imidazole ribonucleotide mutase [Weissella uvarum]|uniref:5-(carboxyamino)imidazole ribonucleotide mutase n=1 Tax=Weissella uvarum TaxID=1479233 RepID=UPI001961AB51|nr:5-(carboxyamino)imidazole ribonucleotide mutase [Weissella uvarum]MBM7617500.1 5-(carboxyamino)imidazole ribonucleotide mutase [Weissella uvarum]MCM0595616.1 5-(carboxyamino)imidazole ribonucleotide mutase [Weissella uvarum]